MPKLDVDYRGFVKQTDRLLDLRLNIAPLQPRYQKLVAEVLFLRVFALLERTIASITVKILCGAQYLDASLPLVMIGASSALEAQYNMTTVGRKNRLFYLKWTQVSEIKKNIVNLMDPTDVFITTLDLYNSSVEEMRHVRNHIAHRTSSTRAKFKPTVRAYYGAYLNSITPGTLLLSQRWAPPLIDRYMTTARILIRDLVRA